MHSSAVKPGMRRSIADWDTFKQVEWYEVTVSPAPLSGIWARRHRAPPPSLPSYGNTSVWYELLRVVDLSALEAAAEVDVDRFPLAEDVERLHTALTVAVAGGFGAAEG